MNKRLKIVQKIFTQSERADLKWSEVENLLLNLGGSIQEGSGSRKRCCLNDVRIVLHKPHPRKEMDKGAVRALRKYLINTGLFDKNGKEIKK